MRFITETVCKPTWYAIEINGIVDSLCYTYAVLRQNLFIRMNILSFSVI